MSASSLANSGREELALEPVGSFDSLDEWPDLALRSRNVFATPEWLELWWEHYGRRRPLLLTACRSQDGRLVAILPLYLWSERPLRVLRFLGHGPGDELGPVAAPEDRRAAADSLRRVVADQRAHVLLAERLPGDTPWAALLDARALEREGSPVMHFESGSWEDFLASRSRHTRQELKRLERKLAREHEPRFRIADDPRRLEADLDTLFALHEARWGPAGTDFVGDDLAFQRAFARVAFDRGWLRLRFLEVDGAPVAADYALRFAGLECGYQGGRDPAWANFGVGIVLLVHAMREALADGVREYRLLRGGEGFKNRLTNEDAGVETVGLARGVAGTAGLALEAAARRSGPLRGALGPVKRVLRRL